MIKQRLFTPGPTDVPPEVLIEMARPIFHHRTDHVFVHLIRTDGCQVHGIPCLDNSLDATAPERRFQGALRSLRKSGKLEATQRVRHRHALEAGVRDRTQSPAACSPFFKIAEQANEVIEIGERVGHDDPRRLRQFLRDGVIAGKSCGV